MSHHIQNGIYVHREPDGSVILYQGSEIVYERARLVGDYAEIFKVTPEVWASIVASVTPQGETTETYYAALAFHSAKECK